MHLIEGFRERVRRPSSITVFERKAQHLPENESAEVGYALFTQASINFPASVIYQSAFIAHECMREGYWPDELLLALSEDTGKLDSLMIAADILHEKHSSGPKDENGEILPVDEEEFLGIMESDFLLAHNMLVLEPKQIERFINNYPVYLQEGRSQLGELRRRREIYNMVNKKRKKLLLKEFFRPLDLESLTPEYKWWVR